MMVQMYDNCMSYTSALVTELPKAASKSLVTNHDKSYNMTQTTLYILQMHMYCTCIEHHRA